MEKLDLLCKSIERIHDSALDALADETLKPQTRKEIGRIAEEALELCGMINALFSKMEEVSVLMRITNFHFM